DKRRTPPWTSISHVHVDVHTLWPARDRPVSALSIRQSRLASRPSCTSAFPPAPGSSAPAPAPTPPGRSERTGGESASAEVQQRDEQEQEEAIVGASDWVLLVGQVLSCFRWGRVPFSLFLFPLTISLPMPCLLSVDALVSPSTHVCGT
ncbi:hypothetical protein FDECE_18712, partial [Fusarium decemcellulare]